MYNNEHACKYSGGEIVHVYMQLLSDSTPTIKNDTDKNKQRIDKNRKPNYWKYKVALIATRGAISHKVKKARD